MNRLFTILIILCAVPLLVMGQPNLVPNGSFEFYTSCPTTQGQLTNFPPWFNYCITPDVFNSCVTGTAGMPSNSRGFQWAASGNSYSGFVTYQLSATREFAAVPLTNPLQVGVMYEVSMSVVAAEAGGKAHDNLGAVFYINGPSTIAPGALPPFTPQINYGNVPITDTQNWVRLTRIFTADSAYTNLIIGCFEPNSAITVVQINGGTSGYGYYFFDSIVVKLSDTMGIAFNESLLCSGDNITVPFFSVKKKQSNNVFRLQLSDASGSFSSPVNIGSLNSDTSGTINATIPSNTPTGTGYRLRLVATNYPDTSEMSLPIKIAQGPIGKPDANNNSPVCNNDTLKLTATTSTSGVSWSWTGPNSFTSTVQNPTIPNPPPANSGNYILTARLYGCTAKDTTIAIVNAGNGPTGTNATTNAPMCADDILNLYGTANGTGNIYSWTGPNSFASNQQNPVFVNATTSLSGDYVLYANNGNCTSRDTVTVLVKPRPANFNAIYNSPVCTGETINFTASSSSTGVTYAWAGPNSFSSTSATPTIGGSSSVHNGDYIATATLNGCALKDTVTVAIKPLPAKPDANNNGPLCAGATLNLTTTSATSGVTWGWTGPNSFSATTQNPNFTNSTIVLNGDYIVTADLNGCTSKDTTTVLVKPLPAAVTVSSNSPLCVGNTVLLLSTTSTTGVTYTWTGPNSFMASTQNSSVVNSTTAATGWYKMSVDLNGCTYKDSSSVTVHPIPAMPAATYSSPLCVGETLQLNTSAVTGATYYWIGPNSFSSALRNPARSSMQFGDTGKYDLTVTVNGCTSPVGSTSVKINPNPFVVVLVAPDTVCQGNPAVFTAYPNNHSGTPSYQWLVNLQPAGTGVVFNTSALNHGDVVRCDMTEYTKCSVPYKDESNDIAMNVLPWKAPSVSISAVPIQPLKPNEYITFTATPTDAGLMPKYQWKRNGQNVVGATGSIWSANSLNDNDEVCVEITSTYKCPQPLTTKSNCIKVKVSTGVSDIDGNNTIVVFPNPNKGSFTLRANGYQTGDVTIDVLNTLGQVVYKDKAAFENGTLLKEIKLNSVVKGVYVLRMHTSEGISVIKIEIE